MRTQQVVETILPFGDFSVSGPAKRYSDGLFTLFAAVYTGVLALLFPPLGTLNILLWACCLAFIVLAWYVPRHWLTAVIVATCTLGFVPNLFGIFNKQFIDGTILSIEHLQLAEVSGMKGRVFSLPLLALPPSFVIWWIREKEILVPKSFVPIAFFGALTVASCIDVCLGYIHVSFAPFDVSFVVPELIKHLPFARQWWETGMPFTLMAFTLTLTFANVAGILLLLAVFNLVGRGVEAQAGAYRALAISVIVTALYGFMQMKGLVPAFTKGGRFESTFQSQGSYGVFVGLTCVFFMTRFFLERNRTIFMFLMTTTAVCGLFINQSRTALMAIVANIFVMSVGYLLLRVRGVLVFKGFRALLLPLITVLTVASVVTLSIPAANRTAALHLKNPFLARTIQTLNSTYDLDEISGKRIHIWEKCLDIWHERPLFGCGQGQLYWELKMRGTPDSAANQFILVLSELGIVGIIVFLWALVAIGRDLASPFMKDESDFPYVHWFTGLAMIVCLLLQSLTVHVLHFINLPLLFWAIIGMALASSRGRPAPDGQA